RSRQSSSHQGIRGRRRPPALDRRRQRMRMRNWLVGLATLAASIPSLAQAQVERGEWTLTLRGGPVMYAEASAIELGTGVAVEALYYVSPRFAIGPVGDYVHSKTDGRYFIG